MNAAFGPGDISITVKQILLYKMQRKGKYRAWLREGFKIYVHMKN